MGLCFMYWSAMEKILAKYGINWKSPTVMNPGVLFDRHINNLRNMWKSKYRCFIIGNRYVCTKDP